ncbi:cupin domain-containing protein [Rufibacter sp. XAAS-G3-1]|uniref:cupin domain-containing protein n=1 Tax=Rufibacter sp. XAAS-G3-1 TaxID=2729134 RepID=UPI0015E641B8|nr:cupin domain-containing protein [Rufibacter sp. XAAS-G3-1]
MENTLTTVSEVLQNLKDKGYTTDFNLTDHCLVCQGSRLELHPEDFLVDRHFRFEGISDPGDEAVVYAISSEKHGLKGTLVNGYGIYSDATSDTMLQALHPRPSALSDPELTPIELPTKPTEATPQRPDSARHLDAPLLTLDLTRSLAQIKEEKAWLTSDRNALTLYKSEEVRVVLIGLHAGAQMKTHTAPGPISVQVLEGQLTFEALPHATVLTTGQQVVLPAGVPHRVEALVESVFLLTLFRK